MMCMRHGIGYLDAIAKDIFDREAASRDQAIEGLSLDQLHRDVGLPVGLPDVMDRADVRMVQRRRRARLP